MVETLSTFSRGGSWTTRSCNLSELHVQHLAFCGNTLVRSQGLNSLKNSTFCFVYSHPQILRQRGNRYAPTGYK